MMVKDLGETFSINKLGYRGGFIAVQNISSLLKTYII